MDVTVRRWGLASKTFWIRHPYLTNFIVAVAVGMLVVATFKLRGRGFISGAGTGYVVICAIACLGGIFIGELFRPVGDRHCVNRVISAFLTLGLSLAAMVLTVLVAAVIAPDPAVLYFHLRRSYIESHWQTDEASELSYFPLDDSNFFVWDRNGRFRIEPDNNGFASRRLISPSCPTAKYNVRALETQIYVLFRYVDDQDEVTIPCLITPSQRQAY
jgi:hypothetical protein